MPYKSDKQRRFFHAAAERGEISSKTVKEYDKASKGMDLPEKAHKEMKKSMHKTMEKTKHGYMGK